MTLKIKLRIKIKKNKKKLIKRNSRIKNKLQYIK